MKKTHYSWGDIQKLCMNIAEQLENDEWKPDYIVGITRGGAVPGVMLSHYLNVPMHPLEVSLRTEGGYQIHDSGMAEDAIGYVPVSDRSGNELMNPTLRKKILIVDDINDTGATFNWIKNSWEDSIKFLNWDGVWGHNVRFAALVNNSVSKASVNYAGTMINKSVDDSWIVFPFEDWWE